MPIQRNKTQEKKPATNGGKKPAAEKEESKSLASAFDEAKPQGQTEAGKYDAILIEAVLQKADEKGQSARFKYEIASEGDNQGNQITQFYKLVNADGSRGSGLAYLKRDLAVLQKGDVKGSELEEALEELTTEMPGVSVTVKQNEQWTNVYLNSISESDIIDGYKEKRGF
jgi:hypothetical protein